MTDNDPEFVVESGSCTLWYLNGEYTVVQQEYLNIHDVSDQMRILLWMRRRAIDDQRQRKLSGHSSANQM